MERDVDSSAIKYTIDIQILILNSVFLTFNKYKESAGRSSTKFGVAIKT